LRADHGKIGSYRLSTGLVPRNALLFRISMD
jgi:hypothetical protein